MAQQIGKLSALKVSKIKEAGRYPDGGNLYLQVTNSGSKSWLFRFMLNGKSRQMGLGSCNNISLSEARELAADARKLVGSNVDPIEARKNDLLKARLQEAKSQTFKQCAEAYIEAHKSGWRNAKHTNQWTNTLTTYAYPVLGDLSVQNIDVTLVMKVLEPIWTTKTETATRVRGRIESILDWATAREYRRGENPARWRGKLENLLPKPSKVAKVKHHPALPYTYVSEFMNDLSKIEDISARALELAILTASRTGEVIGAKWEEFDWKNNIWTIPAVRMKAEKEHRVPLSEKVLEILKPLYECRDSEFVFTGRTPTKSMSNMAMLELLKRIREQKPNLPHFTVHGFRSSFRDWGAEQTNFPNQVLEMALAHTIKSGTEAAYRRGDLLEKRIPLMDRWTNYCYSSITDDSKVITGMFGGV